jgi:hypothetical protein
MHFPLVFAIINLSTAQKTLESIKDIKELPVIANLAPVNSSLEDAALHDILESIKDPKEHPLKSQHEAVPSNHEEKLHHEDAILHKKSETIKECEEVPVIAPKSTVSSNNEDEVLHNIFESIKITEMPVITHQDPIDSYNNNEKEFLHKIFASAKPVFSKLAKVDAENDEEVLQKIFGSIKTHKDEVKSNSDEDEDVRIIITHQVPVYPEVKKVEPTISPPISKGQVIYYPQSAAGNAQNVTTPDPIAKKHKKDKKEKVAKSDATTISLSTVILVSMLSVSYIIY